MSSTNKTSYLGLCRWNGSDTPKMSDFLIDNVLIDSAVGKHNSNSDIHITADERKAWNAPYLIGTYMGDGETNRSVDTGADFTPGWGIVFAVDEFTGVNDFNNKLSYNYFAVVTSKGSSAGAGLSGTSLNVVQSGIASGSSCKRMNESGVMYAYVLFRQ